MLIDLDPQASLSYSLGFRNEGVAPTIADVLLNKESIHDVIRKANQENLYLCPSDIRLLGLNQDAKALKEAGQVFTESLKSIRRKNSYVLIDCPPALTGLSVMALRAANYYMVPSVVTPMSTEALTIFLDHIAKAKKSFGSRTKLVGIVLTMVNPYLRLTIDTLKSIRRTFKKDVFNAVIRQTVRLAESSAYGESIFEYAPHSLGADSYNRLCKEFLKRTRTSPLPSTLSK